MVTEKQIVEDYKSGLKKQAILDKHKIGPHKLYAALKKHKVAKRYGTYAKKVEAFCDVCGASLHPSPNNNNKSGAWRYVYTCPSWQCRNILGLRPELRNEKKQKHQSKPKEGRGTFFPKTTTYEQNKNVVISRWLNCEIDPDLMKRIHEHTPTDERWWQAGEKDERGILAHEVARQSPWGGVSRQHVAIKLSDTQGAAIALTLKRRPKESTKDAFVRNFFGNDPNYASDFDIILAWRCKCQLKTAKTYASLDDLPTDKGFHEACPCCGAVCLEIL